jgi:hypothetical protein
MQAYFWVCVYMCKQRNCDWPNVIWGVLTSKISYLEKPVVDWRRAQSLITWHHCTSQSAHNTLGNQDNVVRSPAEARDILFSKAPRTALKHPQPSIQVTQGIFRDSKADKLWSCPLHLSSAEFRKRSDPWLKFPICRQSVTFTFT